MKIYDEGILLAKTKYGETSLILSVFTKKHGIQKALLKGGIKNKNKATFEIGNILKVEKKARLEENLGFFKVELIESYLGGIFSDPLKIMILSSVCELCYTFIYEKEAHERFYDTTKALLQYVSFNTQEEDNLEKYLQWEIVFLQEIGFGLDLSKCVVTNNKENLYYLSPKTGKAVIKEVGDPYRSKMLVIPDFLKRNYMGEIKNTMLIDCFKITSHFFNLLTSEYNISLPVIRSRLENKVLTKSKSM